MFLLLRAAATLATTSPNLSLRASPPLSFRLSVIQRFTSAAFEPLQQGSGSAIIAKVSQILFVYATRAFVCPKDEGRTGKRKREEHAFNLRGVCFICSGSEGSLATGQSKLLPAGLSLIMSEARAHDATRRALRAIKTLTGWNNQYSRCISGSWSVCKKKKIK